LGLKCCLLFLPLGIFSENYTAGSALLAIKLLDPTFWTFHIQLPPARSTPNDIANNGVRVRFSGRTFPPVNINFTLPPFLEYKFATLILDPSLIYIFRALLE
jgi:hypothetical protein